MRRITPSALPIIGCAVLSLAVLVDTSAAVLSVNLGKTSASTSESGFTDWFIADNTAGPVTNTVNGIDLSVTTVGGNIRAIDRNFRATYGTAALPDLSQSWWGLNANTVGGAQLLIELDGQDLGVGPFSWTSWHVDHDDQTGDVLIEVSVDGGATFSNAIASFDIVDGRDEDFFAGAPNPATFNFTTNGSDDVIIRYSNLETESRRNYVVVNGFEINAIPEPASLALIGVASACVLWPTRNRRPR